MTNEKYYNDLKEYANNLIDRATIGEVDLSLLKRVLVRQGNIHSDECFTYYYPFVFTEALEHDAETKNTKDILCVIGSSRLHSFDRDKVEEGITLIFLNISNEMENDDFKITDKFMLAFAFFYRELSDATSALEKTKSLFEKMKTFDLYDSKDSFLKKLKEAINCTAA